jgi:hypothetical protein
MNIFLALLLTLVAGAVLFGVWRLLRAPLGDNTTPHAVAGIVLLLIWAMIAFYLFGGNKYIGAVTPPPLQLTA